MGADEVWCCSNTLFSTELAAVKDYSHRFVKQMDKTTEIGESLSPPTRRSTFAAHLLLLSRVPWPVDGEESLSEQTS